MHSIKTVSLLLILGAVVAYGARNQFDEIQLEGQCPRIRFVNNLDIPRVIGWYYRAFSNYNNPLCFNNDAQTMFAAQFDATSINVDFCCRSAADRTVTTCGENLGSGRINALPIPGQFTYESKGEVYPNFVLDTDYDNFTIVYGCRPGSDGNSRDELIFIYSRSYTLSRTLQARVLHVLQRNGIQSAKVKFVRQGCSLPYLPLPKRCNCI